MEENKNEMNNINGEVSSTGQETVMNIIPNTLPTVDGNQPVPPVINTEPNTASVPVETPAVPETPVVSETPESPVQAVPAEAPVSDVSNTSVLNESIINEVQNEVGNINYAQTTMTPQSTPTVEQPAVAPQDNTVINFDGGLSQDMIITDENTDANNNLQVAAETTQTETTASNVKTHKYPIAIISGFAVIVIIFLLYFFVFMTPRNAFDGTINSFFKNAFNFLTELKSNNDYTTIDATFDADVKTNYEASLITKEQEINGDKEKGLKGSESNGEKNYKYLARYNNMRFTLNTIADFDNGNYGLVFGSKDIVRFSSGDLETKVGGDVTKISLYLKDGKVYLGESKLGAETVFGGDELKDEKTYGKVLELNESTKLLSTINNLNYNKFDTYEKIINNIKNDVIKKIDSSDLKRGISFKEINGHSNMSLKSSIKLDGSDVNKIIREVTDKYLSDKTMIDDIVSATGLTKEEIEKEIKKLNEKTLKIKNVEINLYTNLLATKLMCIEAVIDDTYINISSISNEMTLKVVKYTSDITDMENLPKEKKLDIDLTYQMKNDKFNGTVFYNTKDTGLYVVLDYSKEKSNSDKEFGAKFNVKFYYVDDKGKIHDDKSFAEISNKLNITIGKKVDLFDDSMVMSVVDYVNKRVPYEKGKTYKTALYNFVGKYSSMFTDFTHYYGAVARNITYNKHTMTDYQQKGESLYPEFIFKGLLGENYSDQVMEAYSMLVVCIGYMEWDGEPAIFVGNYTPAEGKNYTGILADYIGWYYTPAQFRSSATYDINKWPYPKD